MRLVLDTNVVISGLLWNGAPRSLLDFIRQTKAELCTCPELLDELTRVCHYPKFQQRIWRSGLDIGELLANYLSFAEQVIVPHPVPHVCRDENDDIVLACAVAAKGELIVTGDSDLLVMQQYRGIQIMNTAQALISLRAAAFKSGFP